MLETDSETGKQKTRDSNSPVEGWMKTLKSDNLMKRKNMRAGEFVRKLRPVLKRKIKKVLKIQKERTYSTSKKRKEKEKGDDFDAAEERWSKCAKGKKEQRAFSLPPPPRCHPNTTEKETRKERGQQTR